MKSIYRISIIILAMTVSCQFVSAQQLKKVEEWWITILGVKTHLKNQYYVDAQQRKQGKETHWLSNGKVWFTTNWKNDIEHGERISYFESGKIESKIVYDMGIIIEEQRFGKPESYEKNHYNSAGLPYQLILHRKWQIVDRETGECKLVMEKEWSPYYAKLVECLVTKPNGDIVYTNPITGEYGLQKANETMMTLYKDNTMKQPTGKRSENYELVYKYWTENDDYAYRNVDQSNRPYIPVQIAKTLDLPDCLKDGSAGVLKAIEETWERDEQTIKTVRITAGYQSKNDASLKDEHIPFVANKRYVNYDTNYVQSKRHNILSVYDDGVKMYVQSQQGYDGYYKVQILDANNKPLWQPMTAKPYSIQMLSTFYGTSTLNFEKSYEHDNVILCYDHAYNDKPSDQYMIKDFGESKFDEVFKASAGKDKDLVESIKRDRYHKANAYLTFIQFNDKVWSDNLYMIPDLVYKQLDTIILAYRTFSAKYDENAYPYARLWLNDFIENSAAEASFVNCAKNEMTMSGALKKYFAYVQIDLNTLTGKLVFEHGGIEEKFFVLEFDKTGITNQAMLTFLHGYNKKYPMSEKEDKAYLKNLKKRQTTNTPRTGGSGVVGGLLRHL